MGLRIFIGSEKMTPEDASSHGEHHAFVFDGLGGAGGKLRTANDGRQASEAKVASNAAALALDALLEKRWADWASSLDFSSQTVLEGQIRNIVKDEIGGAMLEALETAAKEWNAWDGKFPTTIAGWLTFPAPEGKTLAVVVWAGDSRCYAIDADCMKLYSQDDATEAYRRDAMEDCIYKDSLPMNNRLGRDLDFTLNHSCHIFQGQILLLSCSDGFYHCGESPMHFEYYLRNLGVEESFEAMQTAWTDFVLKDGRFEDDSATLETIFIHTDPDDVEALRAMLTARLEELEKAYIAPFPEETSGKSYLDIDACIGTMVKRLCTEGARYRFLEELRANAVRLAMDDSELPAELPCRQVVRQMRSEYLCQKRERNEKRAALETRKANAEKALDDRIQRAHTLEPKVNWEAAKPSRQVSELFERLRWENSYLMNMDPQWTVKDLMQRCGYELQWYVHYFVFWRPNMHDWWDLAKATYANAQNRSSPQDLNKAPFPRNRTDCFRKIQQCLIDQYALANKLAELNQIFEGSTKLQLGTATAVSEGYTLIESEEACLKETLIRAVDNKSLGDTETLRKMQMNAIDMAEIAMHAAEYVRARRELEDFDQDRESRPEPSAQPFDEYLKFHRNSDARYLIECWLETGEKPDCFILSAELQKVFEKNICALQDMKVANESIQKENEELRSQRLALWEKYRLGFEAHDEPFALEMCDEPLVTNVAKEQEFAPIVDLLPVVTRQGRSAAYKTDDDEDIEIKNAVAAFVQGESGAAGAPNPEQPAPAEDAQGTEPVERRIAYDPRNGV